MEHVRFAVPFQTVFYTPHYLARALDLFAREGLEVAHAAATPDGLARALLAGEADIGLSGPLRALGALDRGQAPLVCVAEVCSRVGFFLLGRGPVRDFAWRDLAGRRVLVFAETPMPRLCLEYLLERHGMGLGRVDLATDLPSPLAVEHFLADRADYLLQGQPVAERLMDGGRAHLAASLGSALGPVAGSAYLVTPRFLAERPHVVDAALRALYRAQRWLAGHTPEEIAAQVAPACPDDEPAIVVAAIRRYLAGRTWAADPVLRRPAFDALQEIVLLRGFVKRSHPYEEVVDTAHAEAAVRAVDGG